MNTPWKLLNICRNLLTITEKTDARVAALEARITELEARCSWELLSINGFQVLGRWHEGYATIETKSPLPAPGGSFVGSPVYSVGLQRPAFAQGTTVVVVMSARLVSVSPDAVRSSGLATE